MSVDETAARYDFGVSEDGPDRGTLVIPVSDPASWRVEGENPSPHLADVVLGKAVTLLRRTGRWPENASVYTG
ncbi:hypothetical protein GXB85_12880 [Cellulomonas sp. APG4]|uniref:hypothetical protein n=1 Tax=Cellulomonas sp. APG4 TaxID=1538656 RepID=UPI00137AFED5|nr:hypothetical protein [Cellulomonas sp. APG4]NCT91840.1 hypothetical protein [Cellulomonas sp. APG4]